MVLQWWKQKKSNDIVGLDISDDFLKLLQISSLEKPHRVENFSTLDLPHGAVLKGEVKEKNVLAKSISTLFQQAGVSTKNVAISVPRSSVIIKTAHIDKRLLPHEVEQRVWIEAQNHFPGLVDEIYLDFNVSASSAADSALNELTLIACRKEYINPFIEVLEKASLTPKIIDVNSYALERAFLNVFSAETLSETTALLNLDLALSTLVVRYQQQFVYAYDHRFDGHRLLKQVSNHQSNSANPEALQSLEDGDYKNILRERLGAHLRHTIHHFYSNRPNVNIQKILLTGDCVSIPGLIAFIKQEINVPATIMNPLTQMVVANNVNQEKLMKQGPDLMLCCGLALSQTP